MFPESCIDGISQIIEEQHSQSILFISDGNEDAEGLYQALSQKHPSIITYYNGEDISTSWDIILISDYYVIKDTNFNDTLRELLQYTNHSIIVASGTYLANDGSNIGLDGTRYLHPVRFADFDFTYRTYETDRSWSLYNFCSSASITDAVVPLDNYADKYNHQKLNILYALPHLNLTGGIKCLLTHAKHLFLRGHNVYLMHSGTETAIPIWSDIIDGKDITGQIAATDPLETSKEIMRKGIHLIVLGYFPQIPSYLKLNLPILYWEQGLPQLFGNTETVFSYNNLTRLKTKKLYQSPITLATNSTFLARIINARFGHKAPLLYTGIDTNTYYPMPEKTYSLDTIPKILLVGNPFEPFKNFPCLLTALSSVWSSGYRFTVTWACQIEPVVNVNFPIEYKVCVPQSELAELYRTHDIYINSSLYEAFSMPPLEAMASGTAVIATDCGGINTYAVPGENCILIEQEHFSELKAAIIYLLENPAARKVLAENGRKTALEFSIDKAIDQLENVLYYTIEEHQKRNKPNQ